MYSVQIVAHFGFNKKLHYIIIWMKKYLVKCIEFGWFVSSTGRNKNSHG